jgi:RNA polymerase sigma-70 factor (ECF subfamily)
MNQKTARAAPSPGVSQTGAAVGALDFEALFKAHAGFVWRTLRRYGVPESDTADVAQEVFVVVHRRLKDFDRRLSLRGWMYGISAHVASEYHRRVRTRREDVVEAPPEREAPASQEAHLERREAQKLIDRVLSEMDPKKREVFELYELEEWSIAEIAQAVGCPLQTAYSRLQSARELMQAAWRRREEVVR